MRQHTAVFVRNDKDGDGKLSKEEFKEMMCREKKIQENLHFSDFLMFNFTTIYHVQ